MKIALYSTAFDEARFPVINNLAIHYPTRARHLLVAISTYFVDNLCLLLYIILCFRVKSGSRVYRSYVDNGRAKRDLDIDPEDWLALMTLVEAERKQKAHEQSRHVTNQLRL